MVRGFAPQFAIHHDDARKYLEGADWNYRRAFDALLVSLRTAEETDKTAKVLAAILTPPAITSIVLSGTNLVINGSNGQSGGTYDTLTSTNLAAPFNQWMPVATNVLNVSGIFSFTATNVVNLTDRQRFYRIVQTQ